MNFSGTLNALRLLVNPSLCLPQAVVTTFNDLPVPVDAMFGSTVEKSGGRADIRAIVLDKDDCFAEKDAYDIYPPFKTRFEQLRAAYPGARLLIVSNTAGLQAKDPHGELARALERATGGVPVFRHTTPKPGCGGAVLEHLKQMTAEPMRVEPTGESVDVEKQRSSGNPSKDADSNFAPVTHASQVAVVGDRLLTDVLMGNRMGAWTIWVRGGVHAERPPTLLPRLERSLASFLIQRGLQAPVPRS